MRGRDGLSGLFQSFQGFGGISVRLSKTFSGSVYLILSLSGFWWGFCVPQGAVVAKLVGWEFQSLSGF